jgi:hypothetical protein
MKGTRITRMMFLLFLLNSCGETGPDKKSGVMEIKMSTVFKRYIEHPEPAGDISVRINPPVLRWPAANGEQVKYDVRLSMDASFSDPEKTIGVEQTPLAMFNPHRKLAVGKWHWQYRKAGMNGRKLWILLSTIPR